jgi:hypothetical protein
LQVLQTPLLHRSSLDAVSSGEDLLDSAEVHIYRDQVAQLFAVAYPLPACVVFVVAGSYPVYLNVIRATLKRQIISHTLMTLGVLATLFVGQCVRPHLWLFSCASVIMSRTSPWKAPAVR